MTSPYWKKYFQTLLLSILLLLGFQPFVVAQQEELIIEIEILGTEDVEVSQITFNLEHQVGQPIDKRKLIRDIKAIYKLGLFKDVKVESEKRDGGYVLRFIVEERPRVRQIKFSGRSLVSQKKIDDELKTRVNSIYDPVKVNQDEKTILRLYKKAGYPRVTILAKIEKISEKQYNIDYVIDETPRVYITKIRTSGNQVFSELDIKRIILSEEIDCVSWGPNAAGIFQEEKINQDLALIAQSYLELGYIKVFIDKPKVVIFRNPDYSRLEVSLNITEGEQYFAGKIDVEGDILQTKEELLELLKLKQGDPYNPFKQNQDRANLNEVYQEQGYAFVRVVPEVKINDETRIVDVTYRITKNIKAYIGRIEFSGNTTTRDYVIRREFEVKDGELYNGKKLRASQSNLDKLGFFEPGLQVRKDALEDEDNILDIVTSLKEAQTGNFSGQLGYSEVSQFSLGFSLTKGNLFGRGQTIRLSANFAETGVQRNFSLTFIEPRLWDSLYSTSFSLSYQEIASTFESETDRTESSRSITVGHPIYKDLRYSVRLKATDRLFADDPAVFKRSLAPSIIYNTQNHPTFPSEGINTSVTVIQTGIDLGGNTRLREYNYRYRQFWSLNEKRTLIVMAQARIGQIEKIENSEIPIEDRYRLGGITTVRGHDLGNIAGPFGGKAAQVSRRTRRFIGEDGTIKQEVIDSRTQDLTIEELQSLKPGGVFQRIFNLELLFPLSQGRAQSIRGVVFYDAGNVNAEPFQYELIGEKEPDFFDLRHSAGLGIRLVTPIGVLRFEWGMKLDTQEGEPPDKFDFTISGLF